MVRREAGRCLVEETYAKNWNTPKAAPNLRKWGVCWLKSFIFTSSFMPNLLDCLIHSAAKEESPWSQNAVEERGFGNGEWRRSIFRSEITYLYVSHK